MRPYHHFTTLERERILCGREKNMSIREIARSLGRAASSVSRELKRNQNKTGNPVSYSAIGATHKYQRRRKRSHRRSVWQQDAQFQAFVMEKLKAHWSPEAIVGRYRLEHPEANVVSHTTLYYALHHGILPASYRQYLRRKGRKRNAFRTGQNGKLRVEHHISERPDIIDQRGRVGDWESDSLLGKRGGVALATHVDRKTRFLVVARLHTCNATEYLEKTVEAFSSLPGLPVLSFTTDNGMEFARYKDLQCRLARDGNSPIVYFADPHSPGQRGTNENTNGLLRLYLPKHADLGAFSSQQIQAAVDALNNRPRKCLNWLTPYEALLAHGVALV